MESSRKAKLAICARMNQKRVQSHNYLKIAPILPNKAFGGAVEI
jgi:hypothetical protein